MTTYPLNLNGVEDSIVWGHSSSREIYVNSTYNMIMKDGWEDIAYI